MSNFGELFKSADWKSEKHAPVIECAEQVKAGEPFDVTVSVGKEIAHPNTTEHHIRWIAVYFHADGDKFPYQVGNFEFTAHGEAVDGPNTGPVYTGYRVTFTATVSKPGVLYASSFCNIHGLWESSKAVAVA